MEIWEARKSVNLKFKTCTVLYQGKVYFQLEMDPGGVKGSNKVRLSCNNVCYNQLGGEACIYLLQM